MTISIKVADKVFKTNRSVLENVPYFKKYLEKTKDLEFELDMDNTIFSKILDWLRFPIKKRPTDCDNELRYLGLLNDDNLDTVTTPKMKLDVGGKLFHVNAELIDRYSYFRNILSNKWLDKLNKTEKDYLFIDMNPDMFEHILKYSEDPTHKIPYEFNEEIQYIIAESNDNTVASNMYTVNNKFTSTTNAEKSLKSINAFDNYYTGNPQITFHKSVSRRCTNFVPSFADEYILPIPNFDDTFTIKIPCEIRFPCYYMFNFTVDYKLQPGLDSLVTFKWTNYLAGSIFEYIDIYHGTTFITRMNGEAILISNMLYESDYNYGNSKKIIIPFTKYFYGLNTVHINGKYYVNEIMFKPKLRPFNQLIRLINNVGTDVTSEYNLDDVVTGKITDAYITIKYHVLDTGEKRRFDTVGHEYYLRLYKAYSRLIDKEYKYEISIKDKFMLDGVCVYVRDINSLKIVNERVIEMVELWTDDIQRFKLTKECAEHVHNIETTKSNKSVFKYNTNTDCVAYGSFSADNVDFGSVNGNGSGMNNTFSMRYGGDLGARCGGINLSNHDDNKVIVHLDTNHDYTDKEIIVTCYGEIIMRYHNLGIDLDYTIELLPEQKLIT